MGRKNPALLFFMLVAFQIMLIGTLLSIETCTQSGLERSHHSDMVYIACRASMQKSSLIATSYNMHDTRVSHAGIGLIDEKGMTIYHVEDKRGNAMVVSSLEQFINPGIFYYSAYAIPVSTEERKKLKLILASFKEVEFDFDLSLENKALYCSEFCLKVLMIVNPKRFAFEPLAREVSNPFARSYLGRDTLKYIPVDFFLLYPGVNMMYEQNFASDENPPFRE